MRFGSGFESMGSIPNDLNTQCNNRIYISVIIYENLGLKYGPVSHPSFGLSLGLCPGIDTRIRHFTHGTDTV